MLDRAYALVQIESRFAAIYDEMSPVNALGFMADEIQRGKAEAERQQLEPAFALNLFHRSLAKRVKAGELLSWPILFRGIFRAVVRVVPSHIELDYSASSLQESSSAKNHGVSGRIVCRSGRLHLSCLSKLGDRLDEPVIRVDPGIYRVELRLDEDLEAKHYFLENLTDYPPGDGPDWFLRLQQTD